MAEDFAEPPLSADAPVDVVYTWVDGADPQHRDIREHFRRQQPGVADDSAGPDRFRSRDELRYSLRSLEQFAPWVRTVYLVTNGQVPAWLDRSHPRLRLVRHSEIFPDVNDLPTFSSFAIEANLHRIAGLSEHYLYFNDDILLGRPVSRDDFWTPGTGRQLYFETWPLPNRADRGTTTDRAMAHTLALLDRDGEAQQRRCLAHTPQLYSRSTVAALEARWPDAFRRTVAHRFRAHDDVALHVLYNFALLKGGARFFPVHLNEGAWPGTYTFVSLRPEPRRLRQQLAQISARRPKFLCLNDDLGRVSAGTEQQIGRELTAFLEDWCPRPSTFERPPPASKRPWFSFTGRFPSIGRTRDRTTASH